jgi:hypothetical protein
MIVLMFARRLSRRFNIRRMHYGVEAARWGSIAGNRSRFSISKGWKVAGLSGGPVNTATSC